MINNAENAACCSLLACIVAIAATSAVAVRGMLRRQRISKARDHCHASRIAVAATYSIAAIAWPLLWSAVFGFGVVASAPLMAAALAWGLAMTTWDLVSYSVVAPGDWLSPEEQRLHIQGTALISTAFAIGAILAGQISPKVAKAAAPGVLLSLCMCIAFVIPGIRAPRATHAACVVRAAQRAALTYSQGLVLAGLLMALHHNLPHRLVLPDAMREARRADTALAASAAAIIQGQAPNIQM